MVYLQIGFLKELLHKTKNHLLLPKIFFGVLILNGNFGVSHFQTLLRLNEMTTLGRDR